GRVGKQTGVVAAVGGFDGIGNVLGVDELRWLQDAFEDLRLRVLLGNLRQVWSEVAACAFDFVALDALERCRFEEERFATLGVALEPQDLFGHDYAAEALD